MCVISTNMNLVLVLRLITFITDVNEKPRSRSPTWRTRDDSSAMARLANKHVSSQLRLRVRCRDTSALRLVWCLLQVAGAVHVIGDKRRKQRSAPEEVLSQIAGFSSAAVFSQAPVPLTLRWSVCSRVVHRRASQTLELLHQEATFIFRLARFY